MKKTKNRKKLIFSGVLLILFCVFLIGVMVWEFTPSVEPEPAQTHTTPVSSPVVAQPSPPPTSLPPETTLPSYEARRINFLLVGRDAHGAGENGRSDAMILCSMDTGSKSVTMISFLRDIYLKIPDHGSNRLNASYSWGGSELLRQTLEENFGVTVDVTLEIDFEGFESLIDYLGGVEIELTDREARHLSNEEWHLTEGANHLDGAQALAYSRIRYLDSDFGRTQRQQNVLTALMEKYRKASFQQMLHVTDEFLDQSTSDHSDEELLSLALELYTMMSDYEIISSRIPADGTYTYETIRGMSVIEVDLEENRDLLASLLG